MRVVRLGLRHELWGPETVAELQKAPVCAPERDLAEQLIARGVQLTDMSDVIVVKASPLDELVHLVDRLLGPGGCPWDQAQTHESLKRHLLEETYEVLEAIDTGDAVKMAEELGDLLLQPVMHGQMASDFDTQQIAETIVEKLIRRHPHVFGDVQASDPETVLKNWDQIKSREKGSEPESRLAGIPSAMPALSRAYEVSKRAARAGFEWPDIEAVWEKLREEEAEVRQAVGSKHVASEIGDLLFTAVNVARWLEVDPEDALRSMVDRFTARFKLMEALTEKPLQELTMEEWDQLWSAAKVQIAENP